MSVLNGARISFFNSVSEMLNSEFPRIFRDHRPSYFLNPLVVPEIFDGDVDFDKHPNYNAPVKIKWLTFTIFSK